MNKYIIGFIMFSTVDWQIFIYGK